MNLALLENNSNASPFDSICQYDENNTEYWLARDLMTVMGYQSWQRFETPIFQAMENMELAGDVTSKHFNSKAKKSRGRSAHDYQLTRYACYMVALACDGRKPEVALAKKYFAVKTREAEVKIPQLQENIQELTLKLALANAEKERAVAEKNLLDTRHYITTALPEPLQQKILGYQVVKEVEKVEVVIDKESGKEYDGVGITYIAKAFGFKSNQQCWSWLEQNGFGKNSPKWHNELTAIHSQKLSRDDFQYLKDILKEQKQGRQLWLGE
jgi:hypothetical protein